LALLRAYHRKASEWCLGCGQAHSAHCVICLPKRRGRPKIVKQGKGAPTKPVCEDCVREGLPNKKASWGLPTDPTVRWCVRCGRRHAAEGAVSFLPPSNCRKCEDCHLKVGNWGFPPQHEGEKKKLRWCMNCATANHQGAVDLANARCEDCMANGVTKYATFTDHDGGPKRWCVPCSKAHPGAHPLMPQCTLGCIYRKLTPPSYGARDPKVR
jgi:hypothetical protein